MKTPFELISNVFDYSNIFNLIIQCTILFSIFKYFNNRRTQQSLDIPSTLFQFAFILGIVIVFGTSVFMNLPNTASLKRK